MAKTLCFDLDGTLCSNTFGEYESAAPFAWAITRVNALARAGHRIVILTARGSATGIEWGDRTRAQLERWGVHYDELIFGKPPADVYVDDRAVHADAWRAGDAFDPPGFASAPNGRREPNLSGEALPAVLSPLVSCVVEAGRTFRGRPLRLMEHVGRAQAAATAAGLRVATDPIATAARMRASLADRSADSGADIVYVLILAGSLTAAHLDIASAEASPTVGLASRGLDEVARGLAPLVAPGAGEVRLLTQISAQPARSAGAWPLRRELDGSIVDALGCQLGVVRRGILRLQAPAGPPPVASVWLRALAAADGVPLEEIPIRPDDLAEAEEVLIAGLPFCILPVTAVDGRSIGDGVTGRITRRLLDAWSAEAEVDLAAQTAQLVGGTAPTEVPAL